MAKAKKPAGVKKPVGKRREITSLAIGLNPTHGVGARSSRSRSVTIHMTVINSSSKVVRGGGIWSVKDESVTPPVIGTATFNRIPPGGVDRQTTNLPTGFEWGSFRFEAEDGSGTWTSIHFGNNTEEVKLTLGN